MRAAFACSARILSMLRRLFLALSLSLLFALGQQGAAAHEISHFADWQTQQSDKSHTSTACDQCAVYAQFAAALPSVHHQPPLAAQPLFALAEARTSAGSRGTLPYAARAPPQLS